MMKDKRLIVAIGIVIAFMLFSYPILATATTPPVIVERDGQGQPTVIIEKGEGKDSGLIKVTQIHYVRSTGKGKPSPNETCYKLLGWKWTSPVTYTINTEDYPTFHFPIETASSAWDAVTSKPLFDPPTSGTASWNPSTDGKNSILFGNYGTANVIAVTRTWYIPGKVKTAVESDILFDTDYDWAGPNTSKPNMDLQNIATHEIGHTLGLGDIYSTSCSNVTMYGYSTEGETKKRTLELPDINGLVKIYGL